jgi:transcriptional regulator GlxA family with amidase domain
LKNRVRDILLFLLLRPGSGIRYEGVTEEEVNRVHQVDALIMQDLKEWLHIPVLAKKVHMTEFKLKFAFKKVMGVGMFERLKEARLEKGKQLLLDTDLQIKVIFSTVGYKSLSGFEDAFKEKYGLPPLQYRKKFQPKG